MKQGCWGVRFSYSRHLRSFGTYAESLFENYVLLVYIIIKPFPSILMASRGITNHLIWYNQTWRGLYCMFTYIFFWSKKTSVTIEAYHLRFHVFICAFHPVISSFFFFSVGVCFFSSYFCVIRNSVLSLSTWYLIYYSIKGLILIVHCKSFYFSILWIKLRIREGRRKFGSSLNSCFAYLFTLQ